MSMRAQHRCLDTCAAHSHKHAGMSSEQVCLQVSSVHGLSVMWSLTACIAQCANTNAMPVCLAAGVCCDTRVQTKCGSKCCQIDTEICNFNTMACAPRTNPTCPAGMWCPGAPGGPRCCNSLPASVGSMWQCQDLSRCTQSPGSMVVPGPPVLPPTMIGGVQCGSTFCYGSNVCIGK